MTILELIVMTCQVSMATCSPDQARQIEHRQTKCVEEMQECVAMDGFNLSKEEMFRVCLKVRNKYGTVKLPQYEPTEPKTRKENIVK